MKILLVHKCFYYKGGAEVFFFEVARVLKGHGHQVAFFSVNDGQNIQSEWSRYFVNAPDFKSSNPLTKIKALTQIPYNIPTKRKFEKLLDDFKPDLVHCFNIMTQISPSVMVAARQRNIPVLISHNDYKHICPNYKLYNRGHVCDLCKDGHYYHCAMTRCAHNSLAFSVASTIESYVHKWLKVYEKNVTIHLFACDYMAKETEIFWKRRIRTGKVMNPFNVPALPKENKDGKFGLYFGRLIDEKGVDVLLKALTVAKDLPFVIVGNGPEEEALKNIAKEHNLQNVRFVGPKWGKELDEYLYNAKYVVCPSTWQENFPYVILQAFAACKPVIGSRRGGIPEMVTEDRGLVYEAEDYHELASLMKQLDSDVQRCKDLGTTARKWVEDNFNDDVFYKSLIDNYNAALAIVNAQD